MEIQDIPYPDFIKLPSLMELRAGDGVNMPACRALWVGHGQVIIKSDLCIPVVDGQTSLFAFFDRNPTKYQSMLESPLKQAGRISSALIFSYAVGFYHFLVYKLPALYGLTWLTPEQQPALATAYKGPPECDAAVDVLIGELGHGLDLKRVVLEDGLYDVEDVIVPQNRNIRFAVYFARSYLLPVLLRRVGADARAAPPLKLFVRRKASSRNLVNQDEIEAWCAARGYTAVDPGIMPLHEQAALFVRATHIVGVEGGALTNLLFATQVRTVVVLANRQTSTEDFFRDLCDPKDCQFTILAGEDTGPEAGTRAADYFVPLAKLAGLTMPS